MFEVIRITICGVFGVLAGFAMATFGKRLARSFAGDNPLDRVVRVRTFESSLQREGLAMIFCGAVIIVTTSL